MPAVVVSRAARGFRQAWSLLTWTAVRFALLLCGVLGSTGCLGAADPTVGGGGATAGGGDSTTPSTGSDPAPEAADLGSTDLAGPTAGNHGGDLALPALTECTSAPSLDRFQDWIASGEGTTVPATGSILVKSGAQYVAKVGFVNAEWHVV